MDSQLERDAERAKDLEAMQSKDCIVERGRPCVERLELGPSLKALGDDSSQRIFTEELAGGLAPFSVVRAIPMSLALRISPPALWSYAVLQVDISAIPS